MRSSSATDVVVGVAAENGALVYRCVVDETSVIAADPADQQHSDALTPAYRAESLQRLRSATADQPLDLLVVGGGVVGCGSAFDAASRGLTVGLIEQSDYAAGTSSRSSRLAHGGLRYLEHREFALVHEALTERGLLLDRIAPHLVRPLAFLLPLSGRSWEKPYVGAGVTLYDMLSRVGAYGGTMPRPKTLSRAAVRGLAPGLAADQIKSAVRFYDAQIDDARHTLALARSAAAAGAVLLTQCRAVGVLKEPLDSEQDRVVGVRVRVADEEFDVHARCVLSATGVWTDVFREVAGIAPEGARVRQAKGVHLVVPRNRIRSSSAIIARTPTSVLFLLPWGEDFWLIGTTDTDYEGDLADPQADDEDIAYLLEQTNRWLAEPLDRDDIVGVYCGLRPLVATEVVGDDDDATAQLSREHVVLRPLPGLVMIAGGKYTTYRVMAADAVDAAVTERAAFVAGEPPECGTADLPLVGAAGYADLWQSRSRLARDWDLPEDTVVHLLRRHGDRAEAVVKLIETDPTLGERLSPDAPYLRAEVVTAVRDEGALTIADVLVRRTRLALETPDAGHSVAAWVAGVLAAELDWTPAEQEQALQDYRSGTAE